MELNCHETLENTSVPKAGDIIVVKEIKVQTNFYSSMTLAEGHIVNKIKEEPMSQENLCSGIGPIIYIPGAGPNMTRSVAELMMMRLMSASGWAAALV